MTMTMTRVAINFVVERRSPTNVPLRWEGGIRWENGRIVPCVTYPTLEDAQTAAREARRNYRATDTAGRPVLVNFVAVPYQERIVAS